MQITTQDVELRVDDSLLRLYVATPKPTGRYPGIVLFSEIFQLTGPIKRSVERLAGHGFVVAAPEIFHRIEPVGTVIGYDDIGRMRGNDDARRTALAEYDADTHATLAYLAKHPWVAEGQLGAMGFCIGGHLAMRAALEPPVKAAVCCYPTWLHSGLLGREQNADTVRRMDEIKGELLVVFGEADNHIPPEGRQIVTEALKAASVNHTVRLLPTEHAFMRDEGPRYDAASSDTVWGEAVALFKRTFSQEM